MRPHLVFALTLLFAAPLSADSLQVRLITDEADAVLALLAAGDETPAGAWQTLFDSEGYVRLKAREEAMGRGFEDAEFREFVASPELRERAADLAATLERWRSADLGAAASRALAYLPAGTVIRAKVYPVIKPKTNSFVFELDRDPAIFLYLDPAVTPAKLENTVAHELHHVGFQAACAGHQPADAERLSEAQKTAVDWLGAFGEGLAMLAAAGGPDVHPHAVSPPEDRQRWDRDVAAFNDNLREVEAFFRDVVAGRLRDPAEIRERATPFWGVQGPWYTVGWRMTALVEETWGREKLVASICDPREILDLYNAAAERRNAADGLALWSADFLASLKASPGA